MTDALIEAGARSPRRGDGNAAREAVRALHRRHVDMAALVARRERRAELLAATDASSGAARRSCSALAVVEEVSPRSTDAIWLRRAGEQPHRRRRARATRASRRRCVDARAVLVTDAEHGAAAARPRRTDERLRALRARRSSTTGSCRSSAGFIGGDARAASPRRSAAAAPTTRPPSSAPALAAEEIQIWTDVDGMLTADPAWSSRRRGSCPQLSFDEASELAYFGAKVLHPSTILPAVGLGIPVRILNSHRPEAPGTLITRAARARRRAARDRVQARHHP